MTEQTTIRPPREEPIDDVAFEREYVGLMADLQALVGVERREALASWVRSDWFSPCGFILEGWQGELHREAWGYHKDELDAESHGKTWNEADPKAGRDTINRLLGVEGARAATYATFPFRLIWTQEDEPWIGAAVGCPPLLDAKKLGAWEHIDVRAVILWNPKSGRTRLLGDDQPDALIMPEPTPDTLDVFSDTRAFFAAWANQRASFAAMRKLHGLPESRYGHLPGALVIGRLDRIIFPLNTASALVARKSLSKCALREAVLRSANLPRIEEAAVAHG